MTATTKHRDKTKKQNNRSFFLIGFYYVTLSVIANSYSLLWKSSTAFLIAGIIFLLVNIFAGTLFCKAKSLRLKICYHGGILLSSFVVSAFTSVVYQIFFGLISGSWKTFLFSSLFCYITQSIVFWNGIICVYLTSYQLGVKQRVLGIIFGPIPIANLIMLRKIVKIVFSEVRTETEKALLNEQRKAENVCKTKYPILLVHGVFFRDSKYFNYWGRVPDELIKNGAVIYYGNHQSALSVDESAEELASRIREIIFETGAEKLNIIAHSKGGLDCRKAISNCDIGKYVASLTTINTPHRGCQFADYLLNKMSPNIQEKIANTYNTALKKFGDSNPDFLAAVGDLQASRSFEDNEEFFRGIYCQSIGSTVKKARGGKFPLNFSYHLVNHFDGENDGLVSEKSLSWGEKYTLLRPKGEEGISHGDMIDLSRLNIEGFDVREFYVELINQLKQKGL